MPTTVGRFPIATKNAEIGSKFMTVYQRVNGTFYVISPNGCRLNVKATYPRGLKGGVKYFTVTGWARPGLNID